MAPNIRTPSVSKRGVRAATFMSPVARAEGRGSARDTTARLPGVHYEPVKLLCRRAVSRRSTSLSSSGVSVGAVRAATAAGGAAEAFGHVVEVVQVNVGVAVEVAGQRWGGGIHSQISVMFKAWSCMRTSSSAPLKAYGGH